MIEFLRDWVINIVIVIIFIVFVEIIIHSEKFKKYVKLVTGLVLMVVIINPIVTLVGKDYSLDNIAIQSTNAFSKMELENMSQKLDSIQNEQVISIYKQELNGQIKGQLLLINGVKDADVYVEVDSDPKSSQFGSLQSINAIIFEESSTSEHNSAIRKVSISIENKKDDSSSKLTELVKSKLISVYQVPADKIHIEIQKDEKR